MNFGEGHFPTSRASGAGRPTASPAMPEYLATKFAFITPDKLPRRAAPAHDRRQEAIRDVDLRHLSAASSTSNPARCRPATNSMAAWLDGMEHFGRPIHAPRKSPGSVASTSWSPAASAVSIERRAVRPRATATFRSRMGHVHGPRPRRRPGRRWWQRCTMCRVVEDKLHPSDTDILVDTISRRPPGLITRRAAAAKRPRGVKMGPRQRHATRTDPRRCASSRTMPRPCLTLPSQPEA